MKLQNINFWVFINQVVDIKNMLNLCIQKFKIHNWNHCYPYLNIKIKREEKQVKLAELLISRYYQKELRVPKKYEYSKPQSKISDVGIKTEYYEIHKICFLDVYKKAQYNIQT